MVFELTPSRASLAPTGLMVYLLERGLPAKQATRSFSGTHPAPTDQQPRTTDV